MPSRIMNKAFELNYQIKKKNDYFGLKHLELRKPHGQAKKKTLWTVVGIELMASALDLLWLIWLSEMTWCGQVRGYFYGSEGRQREEMNVTLKCWAEQHL